MKRGIRKGDVVVVISGSAGQAGDVKRRTGRVLAVDRRKDRVLVEGINVRQCSRKRTAQAPQGGFDQRECFIHASNVMLKERYDARRQRRGQDSEASGEE